MAKVTNTFDTYSATANREDLADVIYNIAPTDTPVMTAAGRKSVSMSHLIGRLRHLGRRQYRVIEGDSLSPSALLTTRESNMCQINRRICNRDWHAEASNPAGTGSSQRILLNSAQKN